MTRSLFLLSLSTLLAATADLVKAQTAAHEDIIVSSTPLGGDLFEQTQSVTILSGEELQLRLAPTLGETLNREPGVTSTYFGPGASRPVIRGLGDDRIRVLQNGVGTIDVSNVSPDHAVSAEPLTIKTIDIVRGPASLLYGPNTVGGVVNVIDNRIPTEALTTPVAGKLDGRLSSADEGRSSAGLFEFQLGPIVFHLDGFIRRAEDLAIPGFARSGRLRRAEPLPPGESEARDELPNSFTESEGGAAGASYIWDGGYVGLAYSGIDSLYGTVAEPDVTISLEQRRWDVRGAFTQPLPLIKSINYKWSHSDYRHTEFEGAEIGTVFAIDGYEARLEILHAKLGMLEGAIGYQGQQTNFSALGEEAFLPPVETDSNAVFVFEEINVEPVRLQFGARYDHQSNQTAANPVFGPALARDFDAFSTSAGIVYEPLDPYVIAFSVAYTQRPPTYVELFANGPHLATAAFEIGDSNLRSEDSLAFDLSLRKKTGHFTGSISFFYNRFTDFISAQPTGEIVEDLPVFAYRAVGADFVGGELALTWHLLEPRAAEADSGKDSITPEPSPSRHELHLDAKADYVRAQDREAGRSLPRIPPFRASAALVYEWNDRIGARIEGQYVHEQDRTAALELPTDSYFLLDAAVSYRFRAGPVDFDAYLKGTNLTNAEARLHTSFLKDIAPLPGRGGLLGLRISF